MEIDDFRALSTVELAKQLEETHRELFNLRFRLTTKQLTNYREIRKVHKRIARMNTVLRERSLASAAAEAPAS